MKPKTISYTSVQKQLAILNFNHNTCI